MIVLDTNVLPELLRIAAIALANSGELATRNVDDFKGCGLSVVNFWQA